MSSATVSLTLKPVAGFCVKSSSLQPVTYKRSDASGASSGSNPLLAYPNDINVPKGLKVFINIAWDSHVPPPPPGSEDAIQKAMAGEDIDELSTDGWYVPVIVSDARQDTDRSGKPSLVFDCIINTSLKSRTLKDPEFKAFITELSLQRVEARSSIILVRPWATPNIPSKGKLEPRTVVIPTVLYPVGHPNRRVAEPTAARKKKLIQEIETSAEESKESMPPKGILKNASPVGCISEWPAWSWSKDDDSLHIIIQVPKLTHASISSSTLDLEARRILLDIPSLYALDVNLGLSDAELQATGASDRTLTLKRMRDLDVDHAHAEWRVAEGVIDISA